jgi:hypothetical protein|nr:MAG TPA: hypothetical protein [Caudoviricetes sp.]
MNNKIKNDYAYCSGVACKMRKQCNRYLPDPPDARLWWIDVKYKEETGECVHFQPVTQQQSAISK